MSAVISAVYYKGEYLIHEDCFECKLGMVLGFARLEAGDYRFYPDDGIALNTVQQAWVDEFLRKKNHSLCFRPGDFRVQEGLSDD